MTKTPKTWVAMSAATVSVPASDDGISSPERRLIGIGLFIAEHGENDRWHFRRHTHAVVVGDSESAVLEVIADRLPLDATLIGWNIDQVLVPTLLGAATSAPPVVAHHFAARLYRLLRGGAVDMALCHGGMGAPLLARVVRDLTIVTPIVSAKVITRAWARGETAALDQHLADEALALWRLFVRSAGPVGIEAERATDAWLERRTRIRPVSGRGAGKWP